MKKFLSMALALVMAFNFTLLGSRNIVDALYEDYDCEYNCLDCPGCDDDYVYFKVDEGYFKKLTKDSRVNFVQYDGEYFIIKIHKKDVKEIIEEKPSTFWKIAKAVSWVAYTGIAAITSCGLYRIYNQHIDKMDKDKTTINENSTFFERIDANAANYTKMFNLYVDGTISPNLLGNSSIFNKGINGTKSFIEAKFKGIQTFLNKIRSFGKKTNSSNTNTQQPTNSSTPIVTTATNSSNPIITETNSSTPTVPATNSSNTKTQQQPQKPVETPQPQASPSPTPTPTFPPKATNPTEQKEEENTCGEGFHLYKDGKCVPNN